MIQLYVFVFIITSGFRCTVFQSCCDKCGVLCVHMFVACCAHVKGACFVHIYIYMWSLSQYVLPFKLREQPPSPYIVHSLWQRTGK